MESIKHWLHYAFQRHSKEEEMSDKPKGRNMNMLEECINSAVIVDDQEQEIKDLSELLKNNGIYVEQYIYDGDIHVDGVGRRKNRNIIFVDLMLNNNQNQVRENISSVINVLKKLTDGRYKYQVREDGDMLVDFSINELKKDIDYWQIDMSRVFPGR